MIALITQNLLWTEGLYIALALGALALIGWRWFKPLLWLSVVLFAFSFYFFRNPERECKELVHDSSVIVCPADGRVVAIEKSEHNAFEGYAQKVSIFLSPLDVHVNWTPMAGSVQRVAYKTGAFMFAFLPKSSELNERNDIVLENDRGQTLLVRQIAGTIARRICCWVIEGQQLGAATKYGMIRFGSRVDIFVPADVDLAVSSDDYVYGGQTVLGRWQV